MAGSVDLGSVYATLELRTQDFDKSIQNSTKTVGGLGQTIMGVFGGTLLYSAFNRATTAITDFGKAALGTADNFEQWRVAFDVMLGSSDKAKTLLNEISEFATRTPFDLPQVVSGAKSLLAYNIEAEKVLPTFEALGNIAAAVGKEKLPQLTLAFGQVKAAGKLTGQELRQFTEAGVPMLQLLADQAGMTAKQFTEYMAKDGVVSFEMVEKAIMSTSQEGGKFYKLMEKQSQTFGGTMSNLKDQVARFSLSMMGLTTTGDIVEDGFFDKIKDAASGFLTFINNNSETIKEALSNIGKYLADAISTVVKLVKVVASHWGEWSGVIVNTIGKIKDTAIAVGNYLMPKLTALWNTFTTQIIPAMKELWQGALAPLSQFIGTVLVGAIGLAIDILNALGRIIKPIISVISAFKEVIVALAIGFAALKIVKTIEGMIKSFTATTVISTATTKGLGAAFTMVTTAINPLMIAVTAVGIAFSALNTILQKSEDANIRLLESQGALSDRLAEDAATRYQKAIQAYGDLASSAQVYLSVTQQLKFTEEAATAARDKLAEATKKYGADSQQAKDAQAELSAKEAELMSLQNQRKAEVDKLVQSTDNMTLSAGALKNITIESMKEDLAHAIAIRDSAAARGEDTTAIQGVITKLENIIKIKDQTINIDHNMQGAQTQLDALKTKLDNLPKSKTIQVMVKAAQIGFGSTNPIPVFDNLKLGGNAQGTDYWGGGMTMVGEQGPELVSLPKGSQITPNHDLGKIGSSLTVYGDINIANQQDADYLLQRLSRRQDLTVQGLVGA